MNVLIVCQWGRNRSKHLASYLEQKGYMTKFGGIGIESDNPITKTTVDWSEVIIFVQPKIKESFLQRFTLDHQCIITLDVEDSVQVLAGGEQVMSDQQWNVMQQHVYAELENQITPYLPLLSDHHIHFNKLRLEDLPLMHTWLNQPFVKAWYSTHEVTDQPAIAARYIPNITGQQPTYSYLAYYQEVPVGYIQTYKISDYPDYAQYLQMDTKQLAGVDLFIGNPEYVGKGLGSVILKQFLHEIVLKMPDITGCLIGPDPNNTRAIRSYTKAGFVYLKTVYNPVDDASEYLMMLQPL